MEELKILNGSSASGDLKHVKRYGRITTTEDVNILSPFKTSFRMTIKITRITHFMPLISFSIT